MNQAQAAYILTKSSSSFKFVQFEQMRQAWVTYFFHKANLNFSSAQLFYTSECEWRKIMAMNLCSSSFFMRNLCSSHLIWCKYITHSLSLSLHIHVQQLTSNQKEKKCIIVRYIHLCRTPESKNQQKLTTK